MAEADEPLVRDGGKAVAGAGKRPRNRSHGVGVAAQVHRPHQRLLKILRAHEDHHGGMGGKDGVERGVERPAMILAQALGDLGAQAKQIENHTLFVNKLSDVLTAGVGNLVDADLAKESARLQALQVQQQLGAQALSIANQAPQVILSLFRS